MMDGHSPAEHARGFIRALAELSDRLGAQGVVVSSLWADWGCFGSWVLKASRGTEEASRDKALRRRHFDARGPEVWRVTWDGRERLLRIESSPSGAIEGPDRFTSQLERTFDSLAESMAFAEDYLLTRLR